MDTTKLLKINEMHNFFLHKNILIFRRFFNSANRLFIIKVTIIEGCFDKALLHSDVFCRVFDKVPKSRNNPHINTEPIIALTLLDCKNVFLMHPSIIHQIRTRYMMVLHHFTQNNTETAVVCIKFFLISATL